MAFAAAAWSDPLIIRIFYINEHCSASEWTFQGGSWANTTNTMPSEVDAIKAGQPVAASRSANGTGRYLEYFYAASTDRINYVARLGPDQGSFLGRAAEYEVPPPPEGLNRGDKIAIVSSVVGAVISILGVVGWKTERGRRWLGGIAKVFRWRKQKVVTEQASSE